MLFANIFPIAPMLLPGSVIAFPVSVVDGGSASIKA